MNIKKIALSFIFFMFFSSAFADDPEVSLEDADALFRQASSGRVTVERVFEGPNNITGVVMVKSKDKEKGIAWIVSEDCSLFADCHKNIIGGIVMDDHGKNLSLEAHEKYIGKFKPNEVNDANNKDNVGAELMSVIERLPSITLGDESAKKMLYVFGDVNCPSCQDLYRLLATTDLHDISVKWIPVSVIGEKSADQAVTLLNTPHDKQVDLLSAHHGPLHTEIPRMDHSDPRYQDTKDKIDFSLSVLAKLGIGTPLLAYWNGNSVDIIPRGPSKEQLVDAISRIRPR